MKLFHLLTLFPILAISTPLTARAGTSTFRLSVSFPGIDYGKYLTGFVSYANGTAQVGRAKYNIYSEPLLLTGGNGGLSFLSFHQTPTGFVQLYIRPGQTAALGFGTPHGSVPQGVQTTGFKFNSAGNLTVDGKQDWLVCADQAQEENGSGVVYWKGGYGLPAGLTCHDGVTLTKAYGCKDVLY
ncbi:MAG: hypothetical protein M1814_001759 [Vezdaea aestivalis]|nr:MAG: hypothetical protein M1814_001759 [Vezdaea aestivalis]